MDPATEDIGKTDGTSTESYALSVRIEQRNLIAVR